MGLQKGCRLLLFFTLKRGQKKVFLFVVALIHKTVIIYLILWALLSLHFPTGTQHIFLCKVFPNGFHRVDDSAASLFFINKNSTMLFIHACTIFAFFYLSISFCSLFLSISLSHMHNVYMNICCIWLLLVCSIFISIFFLKKGYKRLHNICT